MTITTKNPEGNKVFTVDGVCEHESKDGVYFMLNRHLIFKDKDRYYSRNMWVSGDCIKRTHTRECV